MAEKFYVQYRGIGFYATRADIFEHLDGIDIRENDPEPRIEDHVKITEYAGRQDDGGRISSKRRALNGEWEYRIDSRFTPYGGSINDWFKRNEFTINRLRGR